VTQNRLLHVGAALLLGLLTAACGGGAAPAPTPDPFTGLADRSDQAFRDGLEAYAQGSYRAALDDFERARLLSPTGDPRIQQMIDRTRGALEPTPTPVPPTATPVPASPTPTPAAMSTASADTDLGQAYFGKVMLGVVPARNSQPTSASEFFYQDQIGVWIEGLDKHLRLPFMLRVFDTTSSRLVAEVSSDTQDAVTPGATSKPTQPTPTRTLNLPGALAASPTPASPVPSDYRLARFFDNYVWYHTGGEEPGAYRLELYANGSLTNTFDYTVGTLPIAAPTPTEVPVPTAQPTIPPLVVEDVPPTPTPRPRVVPTSTPTPLPPTPTPVPPTATPLPTATPTVLPTPAVAYTTLVGRAPTGLDIDVVDGRSYVADASGVVWTTDAPGAQQRTTLGAPVNVAPSVPSDVAVDQTTGFLYVAASSGPQGACHTQAAPAAVGCVVVVDRQTGSKRAVLALDAEPGDLRLDSELGVLYVSLPSKQALAVIDVRGGRVLPDRTVRDLPEIASLAIDPVRHTLYAAHPAGQVTVIDAATSGVTARMPLTGAGLSSVATARGVLYAVNTATHELFVADPTTQALSHYHLSVEPTAVAASEESGAVYVLASRDGAIVRVDPTDGSEIGRVELPERSGRSADLTSPSATSVRPRLAINQSDETLFATLPDSGTLAAVTNDEFPALAREIPRPEATDS
jgi:PQQ-like domain